MADYVRPMWEAIGTKASYHFLDGVSAAIDTRPGSPPGSETSV
jgi:hypothetical protein